MHRRDRFNAAALDYDRTRPGYPQELVRRLDPPGDALEIGCGSGQLTVDLIRRGHRITAVDSGPELLARAQERCPEAQFVLGKFEEVEFDGRVFDLVVAATAFHWIDPDVGYSKAASLLRPGGRLALLSHRVVAGRFAEELDDVIASCSPTFPLASGRTASSEIERVSRSDASDVSAVLAAVEGPGTRAAGAGRWFGLAETSWLEWDQVLTAPQLLASMRATTVWASLPSEERIRLQQGLSELVERHGGRFPRRRVTFLVMARRV